MDRRGFLSFAAVAPAALVADAQALAFATGGYIPGSMKYGQSASILGREFVGRPNQMFMSEHVFESLNGIGSASRHAAPWENVNSRFDKAQEFLAANRVYSRDVLDETADLWPGHA